MESISRIKEVYDNSKEEDKLYEFLDLYSGDKRAGVVRLICSAKKKIDKLNAEKERLSAMLVYENAYRAKGAKYIAGIDEVGRGPFAGPVLTAAVILPEDFVCVGINDSKKLSQKKREELFDIIKENAVAISIKSESSVVIDEINILNATKLAMSKAINSLEVRPDVVLADAVTIPDIDMPQEAIIKGDEKSISIAAASIIAKVTRDRLMAEFSEIYPEYGFDKNSGYGTAEHIKAIKEYGLCPIHRKTFTHKYVK